MECEPRGCENLYLGIQEKEPEIIGECAYCHDDICKGEKAYSCGKALVHAECLLEYIIATYEPDELANALLFERVRNE